MLTEQQEFVKMHRLVTAARIIRAVFFRDISSPNVLRFL